MYERDGREGRSTRKPGVKERKESTNDDIPPEDLDQQQQTSQKTNENGGSNLILIVVIVVALVLGVIPMLVAITLNKRRVRIGMWQSYTLLIQRLKII